MEFSKPLRNNHQIIFTVALLFAALYSGCATTASQSSSDPTAYDPNVFFEVEVSSREVYPDEAIYLKYALFTRYDTRYEGFKKEDILDGFWIGRPKQAAVVDRTVVTRNGKRYVRAVVHRKQIFASSSGAKTIIPPRIRITYKTQNTNSIFADLQSVAASGNEKILQAEPVIIQVKDFPEEEKPVQFSGSMGQYDIDAWIRLKENIEGEFDLNLVIEGKGNVWGIRLPPLPVGEDFKILDVREKVSANVPWDEGGTVTGSKNFTIRLAPKRPRDLVIPAIKFSYFDQETKTYRTIHTEPIEIRVNKVNSNVLNQPDPKSGLVVLLDRSGSMQALDFAFANRFKVSQNIATEIVSNIDSEWFGAKTFAASVNDLADKSLSREDLKTAIENLKIADESEDGTALGWAVYDAVSELNQKIQDDGNKAILLLGDGVNNAGPVDPRSALEYARASKVRIYTVAVGRGGRVSFPVKKDGKSSMVKVNVPVETGDLIEIARESSGDYFLITEADEVKSVSSKILTAFQAVGARYKT